MKPRVGKYVLINQASVVFVVRVRELIPEGNRCQYLVWRVVPHGYSPDRFDYMLSNPPFGVTWDRKDGYDRGAETGDDPLQSRMAQSLERVRCLTNNRI